MGKTKRMDQVRSIIETYVATSSIRATARRLQASENTVKEYIRRGQAYNILTPKNPTTDLIEKY